MQWLGRGVGHPARFEALLNVLQRDLLQPVPACAQTPRILCLQAVQDAVTDSTSMALLGDTTGHA